MTEGSYDPFAAINAAGAAIDARKDELHKQLADETKFAAKVAEAFASHLDLGHSPVDFRTVDYDLALARPGDGYSYSAILGENVGAIAVYHVWNGFRSPPNPVLPFPNRNRDTWLICEAVRGGIGKPILYADLASLGYSSGKTSSDNVATALLAYEVGGRFVLRRTKLDGKVAFLVRERRDDDPPAESYRTFNVPEEPS